MALPALRNLDAVPVEQDGQTLVCLHDPEGFVEEQVILSPHAFFIATCLDGLNDVVDVQYAFAQQFQGALVMSDDVLSVVDFLDERGLLLSDKFHVIRERVMQAFAQLDARPAHMAGNSYPGDPDELRAFLDSLFVREDGPGEPPGAAGDGARVRCLIVPHIDFDRGGPAYAHGYLSMYRHGKPDTVFVFGVSHAGGDVPFILTRKHFETPFGVLATNRDIVDQLADACEWAPYENELLHRTEHSIEFQAVMLSYLYGDAVQIVPILCAALVPEPELGEPGEVEAVSKFLSKCRQIAASRQNSITVLAAADLAHVGRRFGDPFDISASVLRSVEARDREDLAFVSAGDAKGFYGSVMKDQNARRVCGLGCIYAALKTVDGSVGEGELLHYGSAPDPAGGVVSFASIVFPPVA